MEVHNAKEIARELTALPIKLLVTHADRKLDEYRSRFDTIYPSHGTFPVYPELIDKLYDGAERIMRGEIQAKMEDMFGTTVYSFDVGAATFLMDARE